MSFAGQWVVTAEAAKWRKVFIFQCVSVTDDGLRALCHPFGLPDQAREYSTERTRLATDKEIASVVTQRLNGHVTHDPVSAREYRYNGEIEHYFNRASTPQARFSVGRASRNNIEIRIESSKTKCCDKYEPISVRHVCNIDNFENEADCESIADYLKEKLATLAAAAQRDNWQTHPSEAHQ